MITNTRAGSLVGPVWNPAGLYWPNSGLFPVCAPSVTLKVPPVPSALVA